MEPIAEITVDLRDEETRKSLAAWGGATLVRCQIIDEQGRSCVVFLGARTSGDQRAGSQRGVHVRMNVVNRNRDTTVERHARPWLESFPPVAEGP